MSRSRAPRATAAASYSVGSTRRGAECRAKQLIFTVLIALEFKRSLLVLAERKEGIVQVRTVILIALLAIVRKLIIFDFAASDWRELLALAAAALALGGVHWLVRDQDRRTWS